MATKSQFMRNVELILDIFDMASAVVSVLDETNRQPLRTQPFPRLPPIQETSKKAPVDPVDNAYELLGLRPDAPDPVIDAAYKALAKKCHPDIMAGSNIAMSRINDAYGLIMQRRGRK